jgi:hypothetical protein
MDGVGLRKFVSNDLWNLYQGDGVTQRLPATMTITLPGADREELADYALHLRHDGFGTESFPMFYNGLKNKIAQAQQAFDDGTFTKKHLDAISGSADLVAQVMQRATMTIRDWMTMLFGAMATREKDLEVSD